MRCARSASEIGSSGRRTWAASSTPEDAEALLETDAVVADRSREHDVREPLDASPEGHRVVAATLLPGPDHVDLFAGHDRTEPDEGARRAEQERLEDEVVVAGEKRDPLRQLLEQPGGVDEPAGIERRLLDGHDAIDFGHRLEDVVLEVHAGERRLELEQDQREADFGDRGVVRDRDGGVERRAQVGRDREDKQGVGAGGTEVAGLADGGVGRRTGEPGHDRQVGHVADDLDDPDLLVVREMRAFAGVDVDREGNRALRGDPADVRPEGRLVDAAVFVHRENGGGDEAVEIQGHRRLRGVVETPIVIVCYEAASSGSSSRFLAKYQPR